MLLDLRVPEQREAWRTGSYEDRTLALGKRLIPDEGIFVDVGANIGFYTCGLGFDLARRGGRVFAFEPVASNRRRLAHNIRLNRLEGTVTVLPWALGVEPGRLVMRRPPVGDASNAVGENVFSPWDRDNVERDGWLREEVIVLPLDEWSSELPRCDVVKIDAEGADLLVLRGASRTLGRFRPAVLAEFNPYWMRQIGQDVEDVRRFAREVGYRILRLFGDRFLPLPPHHADSDEEVPNYVLVPEERASALAGLDG